MRERFWTAYKLELRQIFRQWSYWLLQLVLLAWVVNTFGQYGFVTAQELLWAGASRNVIGMSSLVVLFLGAFGAGRARRVRIDVLEATFPTGAEITLARLSALFTAALPFLVSALIVAIAAGPIESFMRGLPVFLLESLLTLGFTASLVWLIEATIRIRRWMLPLTALVWLAAILCIGLSTVPGVGPWAGQWNFTRFGYGGYTETWGRLPQGSFPALLNLFYAGMIALLVGMIARAVERRRFYRTTAVVRGIAGVGAAVAAAGYGLYGISFLQAQDQTGSYVIGAGQRISMTDAAPEPPGYAVTGYDMSLDVAGTPTFELSIDVANTSDSPLNTLEFTLMEGLDVQESSVPYVRDERSLVFTPIQPLASGDSLTIDLRYGGEVLRYSQIWGASPELVAFITADGISLPFGGSWYPRIDDGLTEQWWLYDRMLGLAAVPAPFRLRVTGTDMPIASNLPRTGERTFESAGATWAMLMGAPLLETHEPVDGVSAIASRFQYDKLRTFLVDGLRPLRETVARYFPADVVLILTNPRFSSMFTPTLYQPYPMSETATVVAYTPWSNSEDHWFYEYGVYAPAQHFFGDTYMTLLTENVAQFVWLEFQHGDAEAMREALGLLMERMRTMPPSDEQQELLLSSVGYAVNYGITAKLIDVYEEYGSDGVAALLNAMRSEALTLKRSVVREVVSWIDAWVGENLGNA